MAENEKEDEDSKTEEPTERRLHKALEEGQVPVSKELGNFAMLVVSAFIILVVLPFTTNKIALSLQLFFANAGSFEFEENTITAIFIHFIQNMGWFLFLPIIALMATAVAMGLAQSGKALSVKNIMPKASNLSLKKGWNKIFSKSSVIDLVTSILKLSAFAVAFYAIFKGEIDNLDQSIWFTPASFKKLLSEYVFKLFGVVLAFMFLITVFDIFYQRFQHYKKLRMSKKDLKDEYKESEGNPEIQQKIKSIRSERSRQRMILAVPSATVVVTNPTHYAVALLWDENGMNAPKLVAKGINEVAQRIKTIAKEAKVPVVENPPLARSLYSGVELDKEIPPEQYQAVAEVIKFVMKLKQQRF
jgi:flagellar biosynthetic protein FlhB